MANTMVTEVRQRVTRTLLGRRGTSADPVWVNRWLLLTGADDDVAAHGVGVDDAVALCVRIG